MTVPDSYFVRQSDTRYEPTMHVQGAWNTNEYHIAPAIGLLAHAVERDHRSRGGTLQLARLSFDILGVIPIEAVEVSTRVIRPGRSVELVEGTLSHNGRPALTVRAWLLQEFETSDISGTALAPMPPHDDMPEWHPEENWPGTFVRSVHAKQVEDAPGRARSWARTTCDLISGEEVSTVCRFIGTLDLANGTTPRVHPTTVAFPNLDLTLSLFRYPVDLWVGFDTTVSFGPTGMGLTHTVLHDTEGPVGVMTQSLTIRHLKQRS